MDKHLVVEVDQPDETRSINNAASSEKRLSAHSSDDVSAVFDPPEEEEESIPWAHLTTKERSIRVGLIIYRVVGLITLLYFFVFSLGLMSASFKVLGGRAQGEIFAFVENPVAGIMVGILVTVLVQSSSTSTSIVVGLVGASSPNGTSLTIKQAIPIIMGCNIGTSITATLVSFIHSTKPVEFERAFGGAQINWIYNALVVGVMIILEVSFGFMEIVSEALTKALTDDSGATFTSPVAAVVDPLADLFLKADTDALERVAQGIEVNHSLIEKGIMRDAVDKTDLNDEGASALMLVFSLIVMIISLILLVKLLSSVLKGTAVAWLNKALDYNHYLAMLVAVGVTILVQSSSITTSTLVPLMGIGAINLQQVLPLTLGANIGTTITALLAAMSTSATDALQIAFVHVLFNCIGTAIWYPIPYLRAVPIFAARVLGNVVATRRWLAISHVAGAFIIVPAVLLGLSIAHEIALIVGCVLLGVGSVGGAFYYWYFIHRKRLATMLSTSDDPLLADDKTYREVSEGSISSSEPLKSGEDDNATYAHVS